MTRQTGNFSTIKIKTKESEVISSVYGENIIINLKDFMNKKKKNILRTKKTKATAYLH